MAIGDIVYLKSGGPPMSVIAERADGTVTQWFAGSTVNSATFPTEALQPGDPSVVLAHQREKEAAQLRLDDPLPKEEVVVVVP